MTINKNAPPPDNDVVLEWERGVDPWHEDAFPDEFKFAGKKGERREGWFGLDAYKNVIAFVPDDPFMPCNGNDKTQLDESITGHRLHCRHCDSHLTSLLMCPDCGRRYLEDGEVLT